MSETILEKTIYNVRKVEKMRLRLHSYELRMEQNTFHINPALWGKNENFL